MSSQPNKPFVLPPLPDLPKIKPVGGLQRLLDGIVLRSGQQPSWYMAIAAWMARLTLHFGHVSLYALRPWYRLSGRRKIVDDLFRPVAALVNWATFLVLLWWLPSILYGLGEAGYAYSTLGSYNNVQITRTKPIPEKDIFAVWGNVTLPNGVVKPVYFTLGRNIWFWLFYPENMFSQIPVSGRCSFYTYGAMVPISPAYQFMGGDSPYALNPWIIGIKGSHCTPPIDMPAANG